MRNKILMSLAILAGFVLPVQGPVSAQVVTVPFTFFPLQSGAPSSIVVLGELGFATHRVADVNAVAPRLLFNSGRLSLMAGAAVPVTAAEAIHSGYSVGGSFGVVLLPAGAGLRRPAICAQLGTGYTKLNLPQSVHFAQLDVPLALGATWAFPAEVVKVKAQVALTGNYRRFDQLDNGERENSWGLGLSAGLGFTLSKGLGIHLAVEDVWYLDDSLSEFRYSSGVHWKFSTRTAPKTDIAGRID